jgi:hypothetical protein
MTAKPLLHGMPLHARLVETTFEVRMRNLPCSPHPWVLACRHDVFFFEQVFVRPEIALFGYCVVCQGSGRREKIERVLGVSYSEVRDALAMCF